MASSYWYSWKHTNNNVWPNRLRSVDWDEWPRKVNRIARRRTGASYYVELLSYNNIYSDYEIPSVWAFIDVLQWIRHLASHGQEKRQHLWDVQDVTIGGVEEALDFIFEADPVLLIWMLKSIYNFAANEGTWLTTSLARRCDALRGAAAHLAMAINARVTF